MRYVRGGRFELKIPEGRDNTYVCTVKPDGVPPLLYLEQTIKVLWTKPNYGGMRPWFCCPDCRKMRDRLYIAKWALTCRECAGLRYATQGVDARGRRRLRIEKIYERLGSPVHYMYQPPPKPPRMHWSTYERLVDELLYLRRQVLDDAVMRARKFSAAQDMEIAKLEAQLGSRRR